MSWRIAESPEVLRRQLNERFPNRSKASDGGIGDARHIASKSSDHNPHVQFKGQGIVTARDFTHDPSNGIDCQWLADTLVKNRDPRIKYLIWNRQICSSKTSPWKWRPYSGVNAHTKHLHISVDADPKLFDSKMPWDLDDDVAKSWDDPQTFADLRDDEIILDIPSSTAASIPAPEVAEQATAQSQDANSGSELAPPSIIPVEPSGSAPASLMAAQTSVIEVEQVKAEPTTSEPPREDALTRIGNKAAALWASIGTMVAGAIATFASAPVLLILGIIGAGVLVGTVYLLINWRRNENKEKRDAASRAEQVRIDAEMVKEREARAHELQILTMQSAMNKDMNTVRLVPAPPITEVPNSDTQT